MKTKKIKIDGIHCDNCRNSIVSVLKKEKEIKNVKVEGDIATIECNEDLTNEKIINSINDIGFETKEEYIIK